MSSSVTPLAPHTENNTPTAASDGEAANISTTTTTTAATGGAPARVYMNEKIVPYLLEGMKTVTREQSVTPLSSSPLCASRCAKECFRVTDGTFYRPANPLRVLGEFLIQKSNEVESNHNGV